MTNKERKLLFSYDNDIEWLILWKYTFHGVFQKDIGFLFIKIFILFYNLVIQIKHKRKSMNEYLLFFVCFKPHGKCLLIGFCFSNL